MSKDSSFILTPSECGGDYSDKGSPGVYNGENTAPFSSYKRTGSGEPEKTYDKIPGSLGDSSLAFTDKLPKNLQ